MKLLMTPTSPYARKAHVIILEKGINCEITPASPWENDEQLLATNPLRKVPVLIADDGEIIIDSRTICEYLDSLNSTPPFLPTEPKARAAVKNRTALVEGALDSMLSIIMAKRVAPEMDSAAWRDWLMSKVGSVLAYLNKDIATRNDSFDLSDVGCFCLLDMLSFRIPDYDWRTTNPALTAWFENIAPRSSLTQTDPRR